MYVCMYMLISFNKILATLCSLWNTARIFPVPKAKAVRGIGDIRLISIVPALCKVFDKLFSNAESEMNKLVTQFLFLWFGFLIILI